MDPLLDAHRKVYDHLAEQYEEKAPEHLAITRERVRRLATLLPPGAHVLDTGCGVGLALRLLGRAGFRTTAVELSPRMAEFARQRSPESRILIGDLLTVDLPEKFDAVWAQAFIHLFPLARAPAVVARLRSLLQPGGVLSVSTTVAPRTTEGWQPKQDYTGAPLRYCSRWSRDDFLRLLVDGEFRVVDDWEVTDPFGKTWMVLSARRSA